MQFDERGREIPDPTPISRPVGFRPPPTLQDQIRAYVRNELSAQAASQGHETFEEADDFDVGEDYEPTSKWELSDDQENYAGPSRAAPAPNGGAGNNSERSAENVPRVETPGDGPKPNATP